MKCKAIFALVTGLSVLVGLSAHAELATVEKVTAQLRGEGWAFSVTLRHPDTGWDHYADGWEILDANENRLGFRELLHPHVNDQPFTRSLSDVEIPENTDHVFIRPRDSTDGWSTDKFRFELVR